MGLSIRRTTSDHRRSSACRWFYTYGVFVTRFDESLTEQTDGGDGVWGKANITIEKTVALDGEVGTLNRVRGHEIDMFGPRSLPDPFPGIAVEMEWNNKDPFFDRDLLNFQALRHEGAIA